MKRVKEAILKRNREICLIGTALFLTLFVLLLFITEIWDHIPTYVTHVGNQDEEQFIYQLDEENIISQDFSCRRNFDFITLSFSDHDQRMDGKTIITVREKKTEEIVYYQEVDNSGIHYGELVKIVLETGGKKNVPYTVMVYELQTGDVKPGVFGYQTDKGQQAATVNGIEIDYSLSIGIHSYTQIYKELTAFLAFVIWAMLMLLVFACCWRNWTEEKLFLCMAIPLGIVYLNFLAVNPVHDGATHLAKVYHYSNEILGKGERDQGGNVYLYKDEAECFETLYSDVYRENGLAQEYWEIRNDFSRKSQPDVMVKSHDYRETSASSIWEYFPGVIGMTLGRIAGGSAHFNILLTKVFFYIFYMLACLLAIKISPCMKTGIAFTALLPMAVYQATGITYDSIVIAVLLLFFALWMKAQLEVLSQKEWAAVLFLSYIIGCCKGGFYSVILLMLLLVPKRMIGSRKKKYMLCGASITLAGVAVLMTSWNAYWPYMKGILGVSSGSMRDAAAAGTEIVEIVPEKESVAYGIMFLVKEPLECAKIILHSLLENADYYLGSLVGYRMAWTDYLVPWFVIVLFIVLLILGTIRSRNRTSGNVRLKERLFCAILLIIEILGFHVLMLIETPKGADVINGVQGRYFIAWVPVFLFMMLGGNEKKESYGTKKVYLYYGIAEMLYFFYFIRIYFGIF